jgi:hypothetical protein
MSFSDTPLDVFAEASYTTLNLVEKLDSFKTKWCGISYMGFGELLSFAAGTGSM